MILFTLGLHNVALWGGGWLDVGPGYYYYFCFNVLFGIYVRDNIIDEMLYICYRESVKPGNTFIS